MNILSNAPLGPDDYDNFVFQYDKGGYRQRIVTVHGKSACPRLLRWGDLD